ncbi:MAG: hypothetical protein JXJ04_16180 [Spirochaetales bacterium]|nr:hypothetical protein [Spirochaetales bacterium]
MKHLTIKLLFSILMMIFLFIPAGALDFSGYLKPGIYYTPFSEDPESLFPFLGFTSGLTVEIPLGDIFLVHSSLETYINGAGILTETDDSFDLTIERFLTLRGNIAQALDFVMDLKELYLDFYIEDFDFRIGKHIVTWGLADGNNPTDQVNPRYIGTRYTSILNEQKMGNFITEIVYNLPGDLGKIDAVFMPFSFPNIIPWQEMSMTIPGDTTIVMNMTEAEDPALIPENMEGGARALFYLNNFDFSLSYLTIMDRYMDVTIESSFVPFPSPTVTTTISPAYFRTHNFGLDWATSFLGLDFRGEGVFVLTDDPEGTDMSIKNSYLQGIVQLSKTALNSTTTFSLSWAPKYVLQYKTIDDYPAEEQMAAEMMMRYNGQAYEFENSVAFRVQSKLLHETLSPEGMFLYNIAAGDFLGTMSLAYNIADALNLKIGVTIYGSTLKADDPAREYGNFSKTGVEDKDAIYAELKWNF